MDVIPPERRGELRLRVVDTPKPTAARLLEHFALCLPKGPHAVADIVPKTSPIKTQDFENNPSGI